MKPPVIIICRCAHITTSMAERRKHLTSKKHMTYQKELERNALVICPIIREVKRGEATPP